MPCRSCNSRFLTEILSLGSTPLANALLAPDQLGHTEERFPLDLAFCPNCSLVQITETVPPEKLFRDYPYFSSFADSAIENARAIANRMVVDRRLGSGSLAAEIASNDGYLLRFYKERGVPVLGIEPARNVAAVARDKFGVPTIEEFFGADLGQRLRLGGTRADVLHANNVLAHVPDLRGFVDGIELFLADDGVAIIEVPYVRPLIDELEFDTIYHEHLCYFSLTALCRLFDGAGLEVYDVEQIAIHGGSLRLFVRRRASSGAAAERSVASLLEQESTWGVGNIGAYQDFSRRVYQLRDELIDKLKALKSGGARIAAYGASAKGSTLLNFCGIGGDIVDYIVDRSTYKQGLHAPGTHLPIHSPRRLLEDQPDYVLLLTWNFAEEILAQQREYRDAGGRFIIPLPRVRVV